MADHAELLRDIPLFRNLSPAQAQRLEASLARVDGVPGRILFRKGDASDCFYVIVAGKVSMVIPSDGTAAPIYRDLGPRDFFGEIGVLRGSRRTADAVVAEPSVLVQVAKAGFDRMMSEDPLFADMVMDATKARLAELKDSEVELDFGREPGDKGRVLVFFSARGGAGTTFLACNFAKKIADLSKKKVALLDADLEFGSCHIQLNQRSTHCLADTISTTGCETLDPMDVQQTMIKLPQGFDLFPAPARTEDATRIGPTHMRSIVEELKRTAAYVVVDTRSTLSDATLTMLECADDVFAVLENDIVSITRTIRTLDLLGRAGFDTQRFRLVVNKVSGFGYSVEEIERDMRREILFRVELDAKPVIECLNAGKLLVDERRSCRAAIDVANGAREYLLPFGAVQDEGAPAASKEDRGFSLWKLFGRA